MPGEGQRAYLAAGLLMGSVLVLIALLLLAWRGRAASSRLFDIALAGAGLGIISAVLIVLLSIQKANTSP